MINKELTLFNRRKDNENVLVYKTSTVISIDLFLFLCYCNYCCNNKYNVNVVI